MRLTSRFNKEDMESHICLLSRCLLVNLSLHRFHIPTLTTSLQHHYSSPILFLPAFFTSISLHSTNFKSNCTSFILPCRCLCATHLLAISNSPILLRLHPSFHLHLHHQCSVLSVLGFCSAVTGYRSPICISINQCYSAPKVFQNKRDLESHTENDFFMLLYSTQSPVSFLL